MPVLPNLDQPIAHPGEVYRKPVAGEGEGLAGEGVGGREIA